MFAGLLSPMHLLLILIVILLLFGAKRLPGIGRSLSQGINEFKSGLNTEEKRTEEVEEVRANADPSLTDRPEHEEATGAKGPGARQH